MRARKPIPLEHGEQVRVIGQQESENELVVVYDALI